MEDFNFFQQSTLETQYLVTIGNMKTQEVFYVLAPTRKKFAELVGMLEKKYVIMKIAFLDNVKGYTEFVQKLKEENKPDGLEFGKTK